MNKLSVIFKNKKIKYETKWLLVSFKPVQVTVFIFKIINTDTNISARFSNTKKHCICANTYKLYLTNVCWDSSSQNVYSIAMAH